VRGATLSINFKFWPFLRVDLGSLWIKERDQTLRDFCWQSGYGIFSLGFSQIKDVRDYIAGQETHHRKASFQEEFRALLRRYDIAFDERYVWD
jgi:hypothetical protein